MVDLDKCASKDCVIKDACYRYTAPPCKYRQYYGDFKFENIAYGTKDCEYFIPNEIIKKQVKKNESRNENL